MFAHLETWRPYTACYIGLVGLAGAVLGAAHAPTWRLLGAWAVPTIAWIAGLYGADYADRHLDAVAKPHRPIPSGRLSGRTALGCMAFGVAVGTVWAAVLNWRTAVLVVVAFVLDLAYSRVFKARGLAGNVVRGMLTALAFLFGVMCVETTPGWRLLVPAAMFAVHDAGSNLVGTLRDVEGDKAGGFQTFPVRRGPVAALVAVAGLAAGWMVLAGLTFATVKGLNGAGFAAAAAPAAVLAVGTVAMLVAAPRPVPPRTALRAHSILVVERILVAGALMAGRLPARAWVPITAAAVGVTVVSQAVLRKRFEFGTAGVDKKVDKAAEEAADPTVTASSVSDYIDAQLLALADGPPLAGLAGWNRVIDIELTDPELRVRLVAENGTLRREAPDVDQAQVRIWTTGPVFQDVFLLGRTSPRHAVLTHKVRTKAAPRDLMHLNQLFNEFRRRRPVAPPPATAAVSQSRPASVISIEDPASHPTALPAQPTPPTLDLPPVIVLSDTTLRDGEQAPGVAFTAAEKLRVARDLAQIGVPLIEAGFPAVSAEELAAVRGIVDADLDALIQVIARPLRKDIDAAIDSGAHSIALFIGTSRLHLERKLRLSLDEALAMVDDGVRYARRSGRQVVFVAEDATRTDPDVLVKVFGAAADAGADAIGLADTVGVATPWTLGPLVSRIAGECPLPIAVHCHDDLGLATANSLAALAAGASGVQCSMLGLGERAGNASLEEMAIALEVACGRPTGLRLAGLTPLAELVAALTGQRIAPGHPVVGRNAFLHESGLHTSGVVQDPATYEPYPPELTGRERGFAVGKHSGRSGVNHLLAAHGVELTPERVTELLRDVKTREYRGTPMLAADLLDLVSDGRTS